MNGHTTGLAAKSALVAMFTKALLAEPTEVHFNEPNTKHQLEENVYLTEVTKGHRDYRTLGQTVSARKIDEDYTIAGELVVARRNGDPQATEERAWALADMLEQALVQDPTLDNLVTQAIFGAFEMKPEGGQDGWLCTYTFGVDVKALI